jgi:hypothetical protein
VRADELTAEHVGRTVRVTRGRFRITSKLDRPPEPTSIQTVLVYLSDQNLSGQSVLTYTHLSPGETVELVD